MKKLVFSTILLVSAIVAVSQNADKVDPYHKKTGGFGYLISSGPTCSVWWTEGSYKVMRDTPLPEKKGDRINVWSAQNEFESFIVVINPYTRMENLRISCSGLKDSRGGLLGSENILFRKIEYVKVTKPTDSYAFPGWWPDPLPLYNKPETLTPTENQSLWITVKVPNDQQPGIYTGNIEISSGSWNLKIPLSLQVWDFCLPIAPALRSGFGFDMRTVNRYENLREPQDQRKVFDYYMESFRDHRISPYDPFYFSPIREEIKGVAWKGGFFDGKEKMTGNYAYRLVDKSASGNTEGSTKEFIPVSHQDSYKLTWYSKALKENQVYIVGVECYNAEKELIVFENRFESYKGKTEWKADTLKFRTFDPEISYIKIRLFPTNRTKAGEDTGTMWFDNLQLINMKTNFNEFQAGDFEVNPESIDISLDFTEFNKAGQRYFDEFGFTGYRLSLKGLGGGTFYSRESGIFEGFEQGTEEYNKLMERYLKQMQDNLKRNGWLGKEYIYWFDEPYENDYPFVRETNALIKKYAPGITTFLTEHIAGKDISDVTDISCTIWHKLDHEKIRKMNEKGLQCWSYLCTAPKSPWISEFIDHDAVNMRMWCWASWQYQLKGILIWQSNYWNSEVASPEGYLQDPREEAMSFVTGYGWPLGKQSSWGNGDGRLFYPVNRNPNTDRSAYVDRPVPSIRLEILRDGIEDYDYFSILKKEMENAPTSKSRIVKEAGKLLKIPPEIYKDEKTYTKNPQDLIEYRKKLAQYIIDLKK
jgi:hypothetical protein